MAEEGYRATAAHKIVGITYRQLDYWARTDLLRPSIADAKGSGTQRLYSYRDLLELKVIKQLLDAGVSLQSARKAIQCLRDNLGADLGRGQPRAAGGSTVLAEQRRRGRRPAPRWPGRAQHRAARRRGGAARRRHPRAPARHAAGAADPGGKRRRRQTRPVPGLRRVAVLPLRPPMSTRCPGSRSASRTTPSGSSPSCSTSTASPGSTSRVEFVLERDGEGRPTFAFRPDFYLPAYDLYIEITTLNQKLVTKKNRKVRRLAELHPEVEVKILYQRDYLHLLVKYGLEPPSQLAPELSGVESLPVPFAGVSRSVLTRR